MSGLLTQRVRHALVGSLAVGLVSQFALIFSGIVTARTLGPHDRGVLGFATLIPVFVGQLATLGVPLAATYFLASGQSSLEAIWAGTRRVLAGQAIAAFLAAILCLVSLADRSLAGVDLLIVLLAALLAPAALTQAYGLAYLQGTQRYRAFNILRVTPALAYVASVVSLWVLGVASLRNILLATLVVNTVVPTCILIYSTRRTRSSNTLMVEGTPLRNLTGFGLRALLGSTSPVETYRVDQLLVGLTLAPIQLGFYIVGLAFTNLSRIVAQSIGFIAFPSVSAEPSPTRQLTLMRRYTLIAVGVCATSTLVLFIAVPYFLPLLFGHEFNSAITPARILLISSFFASIRRVIIDVARGAGYPLWGTIAELMTLISIPLAILVTSFRSDIIGVAIVLVVGNAIGLIAIMPVLLFHDHRRSRSLCSQPMDIWRLLVVVLAAALVGALIGVGPVGLRAALAGCAGLLLILCLVGLMSLGRQRRTQRIGFGGLRLSAIDARLARTLFYIGVATVSIQTVRPLLGLTLSDLVFFAAAAVAFLSPEVRRHSFVVPTTLAAGAGLVAVGGSLSALFAAHPTGDLLVTLRLGYLFLIWMVLPSVLLSQPRHYLVTIGCWVASATFAAGGSILQLTAGQIIPGAEEQWGRFSGFTSNFNVLGMVVALSIAPSAALLLLTYSGRRRLRRWRAACILSIATLSIGLLLTGSVTAAGATCISLLILFASAGLSATVRVAVIATVGLVFVAGFVALPSDQRTTTPLARLPVTIGLEPGVPGSENAATAISRIDQYRAAWDRVRDNPFVGVGLGDSDNRVNGEYVHNLFLGAWYGGGLLALLGVVLVLGGAIAGATRVVSASQGDLRLISAALSASLSAAIVASMAQPVLFQREVWLGAALIAALNSALPRPLSSRVSTQARRTALPA